MSGGFSDSVDVSLYSPALTLKDRGEGVYVSNSPYDTKDGGEEAC